MENIIKLRSCLLSISKKLFKEGLLADQDINDIENKINESDENTLYEIAIYLFKISLTESKERLIKKELNSIYVIAKQKMVDYDFFNNIRNNILNSTNGLPLIIDRYFYSNEPVNKLRIYAPSESKESIMINLYSLYANICENNHNHIHSSELAIFDDKLEIEVYSYKIKNNNLIIEEFITLNGDTKCYYKEIDTDIELCFENLSRNIKIETPEFAFLNALEGNSASDFIKAIELKSIISFKKFNKIKISRRDIIKEKKYSLKAYV